MVRAFGQSVAPVSGISTRVAFNNPLLLDVEIAQTGNRTLDYGGLPGENILHGWRGSNTANTGVRGTEGLDTQIAPRSNAAALPLFLSMFSPDSPDGYYG
ncbi:MAG TPA: hypothetical protein VJX67_21375 [Blastocatellia bacterium]|nr:hypothetical protein [Blastocatellia bacterium]